MKPTFAHSALYFCAALVLVPIGISSAFGIEIDFDQSAYAAAPGQTIEVSVALNEPVPAGLDGYALRLSFPSAAVTLGESDIAVVPELDHDLFAEGSADRTVGIGTATIAGFAEFSAGAYAGTAIVTFTLTIPENAPDGEHLLELGVADPDGNNFIDGNMDVIDDTIIFGTAGLVVESDRLRAVGIARDAGSGEIRVTFSGTPGVAYTVEVSDGLEDWSVLETTTAGIDGSFEVLDDQAAQFSRRFYRAR